MSENGAPEKTAKNIPSPWKQNDQKGVKMGLRKSSFRVLKVIKIRKIVQMSHRDVPGFKRHPKGNQKSSKRHPNCIQNRLKGLPNQSKLDPTGIQIIKSECKELQRTLHPIRASQPKEIINLARWLVAQRTSEYIGAQV